MHKCTNTNDDVVVRDMVVRDMIMACTYVHAYEHAYTHTYIHARLYICTHTYMDAYVQTNIYITLSRSLLSASHVLTQDSDNYTLPRQKSLSPCSAFSVKHQLITSTTINIRIRVQNLRTVCLQGNPTTRIIPHNHLSRKSHYKSGEKSTSIFFFLNSVIPPDSAP